MIRVIVNVPDYLWDKRNFDSAEEFIYYLICAGIEDMGLSYDITAEETGEEITLK